jgi:hypothetical protein
MNVLVYVVVGMYKPVHISSSALPSRTLPYLFHLFLLGNMVVTVTMVQASHVYARRAERAALTGGRLVRSLQ